MICLISHNQKFWKRVELQRRNITAVECVEKQISIVCKEKPSEVNLGSYNTVI